MSIARFLLSTCLLVPILLSSESKNVGDYPLRVHVFSRTESTFYHRGVLDEAKGEGRANLFENGEPRGVDFSYQCSEKIKPSFGFETYPAKWKKPGKELVVLFPVFGKTDAYFTCTLKTALKDYAYFMRNGRLESEPSERYKKWMSNHDYDPERGKNTPTRMGTKPEDSE